MTEVDHEPLPPVEPPAPRLAKNAWRFFAPAVIVVLLVLGAAGWVLFGRTASVLGTARPVADAPETNMRVPSPKLPAGAVECPAVTGTMSGLRGSARGNDVTSCPFAEETRIAYARGGEPSTSPRAIVVYSPVTKQRYDMSCVVGGPGTLVTCTGGNEAVVYLF